MVRVFVDTNVLVDLLADRKPFSKHAIDLFQLAEAHTVKLYVSSHSIATTHYLLKKYIDEKELREVLLSLMEYVTVIAVDDHLIRKGLKSKFPDFEDALQIIAANSVRELDFITTRNLRDFKGAGVSVLSPDELLLKLN